MNAQASDTEPTHSPAPGEPSFAETALKLGGKSEEEVRRTGAIDKADDRSKRCSPRGIKPPNSPVHRAVWDRELPVELFAVAAAGDAARRRARDADIRSTSSAGIATAGTLLDANRQDQRRGVGRTGRASATGACWSIRNTAAAGRRSPASRRFSRAWPWSIRPSPAWRRFTAASARSIRCERSATPSKSSDSCRAWPAAKASRHLP